MRRALLPVLLLVLGVAAPAQHKPAKAAPKSDPIVYATRTGHKYHRAGCRYLRQSQIPMKLSQARRLYDPCSVCAPPR